MASIPTKRTQASSGTSFEEQAIYYYIKQLFQDAVNRGKYSFNENENIELDIYIPCLHFAIEYDGAYWHKDKTDIDNRKNDILSDAGVYLVRVRECGLADLDNKYGDIIYRKTSSKDNGLHLQEVINEIVKIIDNYIKANDLPITKEIKDSLLSFHLSKEELIDNRPNIYAQYHTVFQENNIAQTCMIKYWDYQKNGNLLPQNVSIDSRIFVYLTCAHGLSFQIRVSNLCLSNNKAHINCDQCFLNFCPFAEEADFSICHIANECDTYKKAIEECSYVPSWVKNKHAFTLSKLNFVPQNFPCTIDLIENTQKQHDAYNAEMWNEILAKLEGTNDITKLVIAEWLKALHPSEHFKLIHAIWQRNNQQFIDVLKDIFNNTDSYFLRYFPIQVTDSVCVCDIVKMFFDFSPKRFSYKLKLFDFQNVMKDFCEAILAFYKNDSFEQKDDMVLTLCITSEISTLSKQFSGYLYKLLCELEKIVFLPNAKKCKELLYAKAETELSTLDNFEKEEYSALESPVAISETFTGKQESALIEFEESEKKHKQLENGVDEEAAKDKLRHRSQGLCQHCGNKFKKKFLLFGEQICTKCGRKKDY